MADRPLLFVEIDGVLNPFAARCRPSSWSGLWVPDRSPSEVSLWWCPRQCEMLAALVESGVDLVWASTWTMFEEDLDWFARRVGLPTDLGRVSWEFTDDLDLRNCGKRPGVANFVGDTLVPLVWVDDALGPGDVSWVRRRRGRVAPSAAVAPNPHLGLEESALVAIGEFFAPYL